jgi:hypothetical protein
MQEICPYCRERPLAKRKGAKTCGSATCRKVKQRATPEKCYDEITRQFDLLEALAKDKNRGKEARKVMAELIEFVEILKQDLQEAA